MGPVGLIAHRQPMLGFALTASMTVLGEKLDSDLRIGQLSCCGLGRGPFFSGAVTLLNFVDSYVKDCYALIA
jgi:hypothetical protein